jgi:hypothetical protein
MTLEALVTTDAQAGGAAGLAREFLIKTGRIALYQAFVNCDLRRSSADAP